MWSLANLQSESEEKPTTLDTLTFRNKEDPVKETKKEWEGGRQKS